MKKFQRSIAAIAAVATAISAMSIASFAEDAETTTTTGLTGEGSFEGTVEATKYNVVLPTVPTGSEDMYNFILDPQGLIAETEAAKYEDATFEEGKYLFFKNAGETVSYGSESDALTAYNLSSMDVVLTVEGKVTGATDLTFTAEAPTEGLNIQLGIADAAGTATTQYFAVAEGASDATATYEAELAAVADEKFAIVWDGTANEGAGAYTYGYTDEFAGAIETAAGDYSKLEGATSAGFKLVGAIANDADGDKWEGYEGTPSVEIVWSMADPDATVDEAPSADATVAANAAGLVIPVDLGEGDLSASGIASVAYKLESGASGTLSSYTFADNKVTLAASVSKNLVAGSSVTITFNDAAATVVTVDVVAS